MRGRFEEFHEFTASSGGEKLAVPVNQQDDTTTICINEETRLPLSALRPTTRRPWCGSGSTAVS